MFHNIANRKLVADKFRNLDLKYPEASKFLSKLRLKVSDKFKVFSLLTDVKTSLLIVARY